MQRSIKAIQNETEVYFQRMSTVMQWTNEKLEALSAVQEILRRSFTDAHTLLSFTLKIVLVYFITAIPGVCDDDICWLFLDFLFPSVSLHSCAFISPPG